MQFVLSFMYLSIYVSITLSIYTQCISSLAAGDASEKFEVHLKVAVKWNLQMHLWRPCLSELGDACGGHNCGNLEAVIKKVWACTWRP